MLVDLTQYLPDGPPPGLYRFLLTVREDGQLTLRYESRIPEEAHRLKDVDELAHWLRSSPDATVQVLAGDVSGPALRSALDQALPLALGALRVAVTYRLRQHGDEVWVLCGQAQATDSSVVVYLESATTKATPLEIDLRGPLLALREGRAQQVSWPEAFPDLTKRIRRQAQILNMRVSVYRAGGHVFCHLRG